MSGQGYGPGLVEKEGVIWYKARLSYALAVTVGSINEFKVD